MRTKLKITEGIFPMPVLMVATYNEDGSVNVMNAAWCTMQERDTVALNLTACSVCPSRSTQSCPRTGRRSSNRNIFDCVCFHTFTRKFHPTGIVAGGTAAGAFSPAAALPFLEVNKKRTILWQNNSGRAVFPRPWIPA